MVDCASTLRDWQSAAAARAKNMVAVMIEVLEVFFTPGLECSALVLLFDGTLLFAVECSKLSVVVEDEAEGNKGINVFFVGTSRSSSTYLTCFRTWFVASSHVS